MILQSLRGPGVFFSGVDTHRIRCTTFVLCRKIASLQTAKSALPSCFETNLPGQAYLEHHNLQHQTIRLLGAGIRSARDLLHTGAGIGTRAAGVVRAGGATAVEGFQTVGQGDADHGGYKVAVVVGLGWHGSLQQMLSTGTAVSQAMLRNAMPRGGLKPWTVGSARRIRRVT